MRNALANAPAEREMRKFIDMEQESHKVLLLGAGESGKSTFFKQVKLRFGSGFDDAGKKQFVGAIHCNIISAIQALCRNSDKLAQEGVQGTAIDDEKVEACKAAACESHARVGPLDWDSAARSRRRIEI